MRGKVAKPTNIVTTETITHFTQPLVPCGSQRSLWTMSTFHTCAICLMTFSKNETSVYFHAKTRYLISILIISLRNQFDVHKLCILRAYWQVSATLAQQSPIYQCKNNEIANNHTQSYVV